MRQHLLPSLRLLHPNMAAAPRSRTPCTAPEATAACVSLLSQQQHTEAATVIVLPAPT
jgi:hypothetical protein